MASKYATYSLGSCVLCFTYQGITEIFQLILLFSSWYVLFTVQPFGVNKLN